MAVQFACTSCQKLIEVDDELAGQAVTCPYCRAVVTAVAPAGRAAPSESRIAPPASPPAGPSNWFASVGLACSIVMILSTCVATSAMVRVVQKYAPNGQIAPEQMEQVTKDMSQQPGAMAAFAIMLTSAIGGLVFSILGLVKRQGRRWQAAIGLTLCGLMTMCMLLSSIMQFARIGVPS